MSRIVDIPESAHGHIGCFCCLNLTGKRGVADKVIDGRAVCNAHVELVTQPGFDIESLHGKKPGAV